MEETNNRTLMDLVDEYLTGRLARRELDGSTAQNHRWALSRLAEQAGTASNLDPVAIEQWLEGLGHLAQSSRRTQFCMVRAFSKWLVRHGHIPKDPCLEVQSPRTPRPIPRAIDADKVRALIAATPDSRGRAIVSLMVGCGLRCCEVSRLEMADWDTHAETLLVRGKGGAERMLPVPAEVSRELRRYLEQWPAGTGPLIRSYRQTNDGLRPHTISGMVVGWMKAAGVKRAARDRVSGHALRHTAASDVLDRSHDLRLVQNMLGHSNVSTTSIYLRRASLGQMRDAMEGRDYST